MERVEQSGVVMTWDPVERLIFLEYTRGSRPGDEDARAWTAIFDRWVGPSTAGPFRVLVDNLHAKDVTPGWRSVWADYLKGHKKRMKIACYNLDTRTRVIVLLIAKASGIDIRGFASEADARRWIALPERYVVKREPTEAAR
jgi:hypothetical protein